MNSSRARSGIRSRSLPGQARPQHRGSGSRECPHCPQASFTQGLAATSLPTPARTSASAVGRIPGLSRFFPRGRSSPLPPAPGGPRVQALSAPGPSRPFSRDFSRPSASHTNPLLYPPFYVRPSPAAPSSPTCRSPVQPRSLHTCPGLRSVASARTGAAPGPPPLGPGPS